MLTLPGSDTRPKDVPMYLGSARCPCVVAFLLVAAAAAAQTAPVPDPLVRENATVSAAALPATRVRIIGNQA